jgi:molybdopterin-guanine dinucleotide biosynthesis protein A
MSLGAVVLCGGASRRMGRPKAWLPFGRERMLERVVRLVGDAAGSIVVVAAEGQELPSLAADVTVVRDPVAGRGPLQGLAAGLGAFSDSIELVYATATDVPFLEPRWIGRLIELSDGHDLVIPYVGGYHHPLAALYRRGAVLPVINDLLRENRLRVTELVGAVNTREVEECDLRGVDSELLTLRNLNSPHDYEQALRDAGFTTSGDTLR